MPEPYPILIRAAGLFLILTAILPALACSSVSPFNSNLVGQVMSGGQGMGSFNVTLYSTGTGQGPQVIGTGVSGFGGQFAIPYDMPPNPKAVLYLLAEGPSLDGSGSGPATQVRLASVLGTAPVPDQVVLNERSTVATAFAMAQFFVGENIDGPAPGLQNAGATLQNLVDVSSGEVGSTLANIPNGPATSTMATFNSLANLLASCVRSQANCPNLFGLATTPQGGLPANTLQAALNIAHFPVQNLSDLFSLSLQQDIYQPALASAGGLNAWTLAIRYQGNGMELDGPGNLAFDAEGNAWITNNYVFNPEPVAPDEVVCGDTHVLKLTPTGENFPGAPFPGGGLYGAGYGITLDPNGDVWIGNFGFQGSNCPNDLEELSQSVSQFGPNGAAISPNSQGDQSGADHGGWQGLGNLIRRPQGTVSDREGGIWIASCGGDNIVKFPGGNPNAALNIFPLDLMMNPLLAKPFDIAIDHGANAWVTSNGNHSVFAFDSGGNLLHSLTGIPAANAGISRPMGIAVDSLGNLWVANSGIVDPPCGSPPDNSLFDSVEQTLQPGFTGENASVTMIQPDGAALPGGPFTGGGLTVPWGIAVDGNDNVWVSNFAGMRVSQFCGVRPETCPPGFQTGDPISPAGGYNSDGLVRNTAVEIDPSGNVWVTNNWKTIPLQANPGGYEMVVFIGMAKPIKTPLIGPPESALSW